uniref:non-specific serine/threonine protein kinase n=2 Tax=Chrysotila carterae TaxID=13221 RepID=A0A7S4BN71_CHRCT
MKLSETETMFTALFGHQVYSEFEAVLDIGRGQHGFASLLKHPKTGELAVAKQVQLEGMSEEELQQIEMEVCVLKSLKHKNCVRYRTSFVQDECVCIISDFANGGTLAQAITKRNEMRQHFDAHNVCMWARQLAGALQHVHGLGLLHRDISSRNILMHNKKGSIDPIVILADFGLATQLTHQDDTLLVACGTPYYMSPELAEGLPYGRPSDVWAFGVIVYEMLTLQRPFKAPDFISLVKAVSAIDYDRSALAQSPHSPLLKSLTTDQALFRRDPALRTSLADALATLEKVPIERSWAGAPELRVNSVARQGSWDSDSGALNPLEESVLSPVDARRPRPPLASPRCSPGGRRSHLSTSNCAAPLWDAPRPDRKPSIGASAASSVSSGRPETEAVSRRSASSLNRSGDRARHEQARSNQTSEAAAPVAVTITAPSAQLLRRGSQSGSPTEDKVADEAAANVAAAASVEAPNVSTAAHAGSAQPRTIATGSAPPHPNSANSPTGAPVAAGSERDSVDSNDSAAGRRPSRPVSVRLSSMSPYSLKQSSERQAPFYLCCPCCQPVPGDDIMVVLDKPSGVTFVHVLDSGCAVRLAWKLPRVLCGDEARKVFDEKLTTLTGTPRLFSTSISVSVASVQTFSAVVAECKKLKIRLADAAVIPLTKAEATSKLSANTPGAAPNTPCAAPNTPCASMAAAISDSTADTVAAATSSNPSGMSTPIGASAKPADRPLRSGADAFGVSGSSASGRMLGASGAPSASVAAMQRRSAQAGTQVVFTMLVDTVERMRAAATAMAALPGVEGVCRVVKLADGTIEEAAQKLVSAAASASREQVKRVLLADDASLNRRLLKRAFTNHFAEPWEVHEAATAEAAVSAAESTAFDVIVMDEIFSLDQKAMRGSEAIRQIRAFEEEAQASGARRRRRRLVVISCTGNANLEEQKRALILAGCDAVWGKPFPDFVDGSMQTEVGRLLHLAENTV